MFLESSFECCLGATPEIQALSTRPTHLEFPGSLRGWAPWLACPWTPGCCLIEVMQWRGWGKTKNIPGKVLKCVALRLHPPIWSNTETLWAKIFRSTHLWGSRSQRGGASQLPCPWKPRCHLRWQGRGEKKWRTFLESFFWVLPWGNTLPTFQRWNFD